MAVFRIQPPPTGTLYSVLQKAKPGWSTKDLLKVYQKLQKVSITDGETLARAVSEGSLNNILAEAGEKRLKTSTLQLLRLASRDPGTRKVKGTESEEQLVRQQHCFCGSCVRVPMCQQRAERADVLSMKLPSISLGPPPLMPSKRGEVNRWKPRKPAMTALPHVKSEPLLGTASQRRSQLEHMNPRGYLKKLVPPTTLAVSPIGLMPPDWSRKVLAPVLATVPEMPERIQPCVQSAMSADMAEEPRGPVANGSAGCASGVASVSSSSFHSYATFVEMQGQESQEGLGLHQMEATTSYSQESYAMSFEGSSDPARSSDEFVPEVAHVEDVTASEHSSSEEETWDMMDMEPDLMELTAVDGLRRLQHESHSAMACGIPDGRLEPCLAEAAMDTTLPRSPKKLCHRRPPNGGNSAPVDHGQQVAAARRQQQRRRMIRAYG